MGTIKKSSDIWHQFFSTITNISEVDVSRPGVRQPSSAGFASALQSHHDGFGLGVEIEHFVAHLAAPAGLFVAAKGQRGVENIVAIDPDGARLQRGGDAMRFGNVARPNAGGQAVVGLVGAGDQFVGIGERFGHDDRAENFLAHNAHVGLHIFDHGRLDKITASPGACRRR